MAGIIVGIVADTHVPDRAVGLHPSLLPALRAAGVQQILHAGDICIPTVIRELEQVAPVVAVRGNRDWAFGRQLSSIQNLQLAGTLVALVHGHGSWADYLRDKWAFLFQGYSFARYRALWNQRVSAAKVVIFGHTHYPENAWHDGRLWFNPGSATVGMARDIPPSFGRLHITGDQIAAQVFPLAGWRLVAHRWIKDEN